MSPAFSDGEAIPTKYTEDGKNISPALEIIEVPNACHSLVLIMEDPDAPSGNWVHWLLWDIDPKDSLLEEGKKPLTAKEGLNDFGFWGYGGPCPPSGTHRYFFRLYALSEKLNLAEGADKASLIKAMAGKVLESSELMGTYSR